LLELNKIYNTDCLGENGLCLIPSNSVHLILVDLPYNSTELSWDSLLPMDQLWEQYKRILTDNGTVIFTASQPFTTHIINSNPSWFKYELIWVKTRPTGFGNSNHRPMKKHENILIFSPANASSGSKNNMTYNPQGLIEKERKVKRTSRGIQGERTNQSDEYISKLTNYPTSVLEFASEGKTIHPTQKPLALFEYLIQTYSNEGETVLDHVMGSGTTAVAAINTGRNYIGFELDEKYHRLAEERIHKINTK
jgi:site-specific DNA-methyltransferase (adenine-specific)